MNTLGGMKSLGVGNRCRRMGEHGYNDCESLEIRFRLHSFEKGNVSKEMSSSCDQCPSTTRAICDYRRSLIS